MMYFHRSMSGKLCRPLPLRRPALRITKRGPPGATYRLGPQEFTVRLKGIPAIDLDSTRQTIAFQINAI